MLKPSLLVKCANMHKFISLLIVTESAPGLIHVLTNLVNIMRTITGKAWHVRKLIFKLPPVAKRLTQKMGFSDHISISTM